jgi:alkanesulfonate monooxygenase SsuD/methylene tetrahydromethanopterin reductase-like flavin-dependent oxidoreductase (luciferase family)
VPRQLGSLLPTREAFMEGARRPPPHETRRTSRVPGLRSVWVGDSMTARPRHEPLTLLAAVSARTPGLTIGTAVLLPMLRTI